MGAGQGYSFLCGEALVTDPPTPCSDCGEGGGRGWGSALLFGRVWIVSQVKANSCGDLAYYFQGQSFNWFPEFHT